MSTPSMPQWLIRLIVIVGLPTIACTGLYSLDYIGREDSLLSLPTMLAYPAAIIGFIGLTSALLSARQSRNKTLLWSMVLATPLLFLFFIRR